MSEKREVPEGGGAAEGMQVWPPRVEAGESRFPEEKEAATWPPVAVPEGRGLGFGPPAPEKPYPSGVEDHVDEWLMSAREAGRYLVVVFEARPDPKKQDQFVVRVSQKTENYPHIEIPRSLRMLAELLEKELVKDGLRLASLGVVGVEDDG